jgi:SnoaL-like polyketide cyclase
MTTTRIHDEVWNPARPPAVEEFYAHDFRNHQSPPYVVDRDDLRRYAIDVATGFPDHAITVLDEIEQGDRLVLRYRFTGTHTGEFAGMPPTGRRVDSTAI